MIKLSFNNEKADNNPAARKWLSVCEKEINARLTEEVLTEFKNGYLFGYCHGLYIPNDTEEKIRSVMMKDIYNF